MNQTLILMLHPAVTVSQRSKLAFRLLLLIYSAQSNQLEIFWLQVIESPTQVGLSKKGIYWLMLLDSPGVVLSVRHNLMQGPTDIISTPHSSILPECWFCSHTVSPLGVRRQPLKLGLKSHCEKGAEDHQCPPPKAGNEEGDPPKVQRLSVGEVWAP